jgi:hypothetical protein
MGGFQQEMYQYDTMPQQIDYSHYTEIPEPHQWVEFITDSWIVGVIFLVGIISCAVVAFRVFRRNKWINEFIRMWRTR